MGYPSKRKADWSGIESFDLTGDDNNENDASRSSKVSRVEPPAPTQGTSNGQRFGEETDFLPLSQNTAVMVDDDDRDADAMFLMLGSQDYDASTDYIHFGVFNSLPWH